MIRLCLTGDVMLGRGVDQVLPYPGDPELREPYMADAGAYVELAEAANGPVPRPVDPAWPWGAALPVLDSLDPAVRVVNLETAVTRSADFAPGKGIHYRMHPANVPALAAARPDVTVLANNHVLDFGTRGLTETLDTLASHGLRSAGAGRDAEEARAPAAVPLHGGGRLLVLAAGATSSGIPPEWAATRERAGVHLLPDLSEESARAVTARLREARRPGDLAVVSVHWGSNWGYDVPGEQVRFAHALIDGGADLVHGHSSHHPRPVELYRGRLVLYGCGDFVDDYEGITGYERYRDDLRLLLSVTLGAGTGELRDARAYPFQARRMSLVRASEADTGWLASVVDGISRPFGVRAAEDADGTLVLRRGWSGSP